MKLQDLFKVDKPIIGVVHLKPLPGSPRYGGSLDEVLGQALRDCRALVDGGVNGILVENYGDAPYLPRRVGPETVASMAVVVKELVKQVRVPVGVNVLRCDGEAALAIAAACNASFIRVNVYVGAAITDQGLIEGRSYDIVRLRFRLRTDVKVFADVAVKHAAPLTYRSAAEEALDAIERGLADAVILTGRRTGQPPSINVLEEVKKALPNTPVLVGSGVNLENVISLLSITDGAIIGTYFKEKGQIDQPVDRDRVKRLINTVLRLRGQ